MSNTPVQVLLVDDDADLRDLLRAFFQQHGIELSVLHDANRLERRLERERPSLVILDVMLPGIDGLTALKQLRASGDMIPVIMLTALADDADRAIGLELGADDYLCKPFMPQELLARIRAVLRHHVSQSQSQSQPQPQPTRAREQHEPVRFGRYRLDFATRTLFRDDEPLKLSSSEYALLKVFAQHPMKTLSRAKLLDLLYGTLADRVESCISVCVWRLRQLLEEDPSQPRVIQTVHGIGYIFVPGSSADRVLV
jgi:two-component system, OmpR family, phosphate regulon response regulator OmpR